MRNQIIKICIGSISEYTIIKMLYLASWPYIYCAIVGSIKMIKVTRAKQIMIDVSVARKSIFCAPISPADNQFRCEIRSLGFSCSFCDARNQYGISPIQCVEQEKYIASSKAFPVFMSHYIVLREGYKGRERLVTKDKCYGKWILQLET